MSLEPAAVWHALQEVQDGADPADIYQRLISESVDLTEAIENDYMDHVEESHDFKECRDKHLTRSYCYGFTCVPINGGNLMCDCPCECHKDES